MFLLDWLVLGSLRQTSRQERESLSSELNTCSQNEGEGQRSCLPAMPFLAAGGSTGYSSGSRISLAQEDVRG